MSINLRTLSSKNFNGIANKYAIAKPYINGINSLIISPALLKIPPRFFIIKNSIIPTETTIILDMVLLAILEFSFIFIMVSLILHFKFFYVLNYIATLLI